jgi:5-hydroxyisourate hydrolase-like protein (transthyretin family)
MSKINDVRNNKKFRLGMIVLLMIVVAVLYFRNVNTDNLTTAEGIKSELSGQLKPDTTEKKVLIGIMGLLGVGAGMEASNNDIDLGKVIENKSFVGSKVLRDKDGNVVTAEEVKAGTKQGKYTNEYNCDDFKSQPQAQKFFANAGGVSNDTNRLDGNKDGKACTSLPIK